MPENKFDEFYNEYTNGTNSSYFRLDDYIDNIENTNS